MKFRSFNSGISIIETLAAIAIIGILTSIVIFSFSSVSGDRYLDSDAHSVLSLLDRARSLTLAAKNDTSYGVHFTSTSATLFVGTTYSSGGAGNEVYTLNPQIQITPISLAGGGSNVVFERLSGKTDEYGTVTVSVTATSSKNRVITIYSTGISELDTQ